MTTETSTYASQVSPETALSLQRQVGELQAHITQLEAALQQQRVAVEDLRASIPNSNIVSPRFLSRAFAVWGHVFVAGLILTAVFYGGLAVLLVLATAFGAGP